jgi:L-amino acid N-acyltransferase YncA
MSRALGRPDAGPAIAVRDATADDIAQIAAIYRPYVETSKASFETAPPDEAELARRRAEVVGRGLPWLVAELDGRVAGYAYAAPYRVRAAYRYTVEDSVYVAPWALGRGCGRSLLDALVRRCELAGYRAMVAVIGDSANAASIALHKACGFAAAGTLPNVGWKLGAWVDSVMMVRPLGAGAGAPPTDRTL